MRQSREILLTPDEAPEPAPQIAIVETVPAPSVEKATPLATRGSSASATEVPVLDDYLRAWGEMRKYERNPYQSWRSDFDLYRAGDVAISHALDMQRAGVISREQLGKLIQTGERLCQGQEMPKQGGGLLTSSSPGYFSGVDAGARAGSYASMMQQKMWADSYAPMMQQNAWDNEWRADELAQEGRSKLNEVMGDFKVFETMLAIKALD